MKLFRAIVKFLIKNKKPNVRFELMVNIGNWLVPQYRFKWPQMQWWDCDNFNKFLRLFGELDGMNTDRRWMLYQLLRLVEYIPGDTAECGVFKGAGSYLICESNNYSKINKYHHIFDSFEGLSEISTSDGSHWSKHDLAISQDIVEKNLKTFRQVEFYKGWIPDKFSEVSDKKFSCNFSITIGRGFT